MAQADLSGLTYFLPIISFLIVFIISFAVLNKTKIIEHKWVQIFLSFLFSTLFISAAGAKDYVLNVIPWFAILLICLFLLLMLIGFVGKDLASWNKGIGITFVVILLAVFVISGVFVFSDVLSPYLPGSSGYGGNPNVLRFTDWLYSPRILGALFLLGISAVVTWVLVSADGKKG